MPGTAKLACRLLGTIFKQYGNGAMQLTGIAQNIWDEKYRYKNNAGEPVDATVRDTFTRVATALAEAEPPSQRDAVACYNRVVGGNERVHLGKEIALCRFDFQLGVNQTASRHDTETAVKPWGGHAFRHLAQSA